MNSFEVKKKINIDKNKGIFNLYENNHGVKVVHIKNTDINKVFIAGFKTLAENDMGVAHALEHCLLSSSNGYSDINIFEELSKNTFYNYLNALTYHDRTAYVVSSINNSEFKKQVCAYIDGIFEPIFKEDLFLKEVINKKYENNNITYNGVMLNEMETYFDDYDNMIKHEIFKRVYSNNYKYCNFGKPNNIKNIEYRDIIQYYERNYNIKNSFIYLYGDIDIKFYLDYIENYSYKNINKVENYYIKTNEFIPMDNSIIINRLKDNYFSFVYKIDEQLDYSNELIQCFIEFICEVYLKKKYSNLNYVFDTDIKEPILIIYFRDNKKISIDKLKENFYKDLLDIKDKFSFKEFEIALKKIKYFYTIENYGYKPRGVFYGLELFKNFVHRDILDLKSINFIEKVEINDVEAFVNNIFELIFLNNKHISVFNITAKNHNISEDVMNIHYFNKSELYFQKLNSENLIHFINLQICGIIFIDIQLVSNKDNKNIFNIKFYEFLLNKKIKMNFRQFMKCEVVVNNNSIVIKIKSNLTDKFTLNNLLLYMLHELIIDELDIIDNIEEYKVYFSNKIKNDDDFKYEILSYGIDYYDSQIENSIDLKEMLKDLFCIHKNCIDYFDFKCNIGMNFKLDNFNHNEILDLLSKNKSNKNRKEVKKKFLNLGLITNSNVNTNVYCLKVLEKEFDYSSSKIISILIEKEILSNKLRVDKGVYDFGVKILENNILFYSKSDPNILETYMVFEKSLEELLKMKDLDKKIIKYKKRLLNEEVNNFNNEWYFDKVSKNIFDNKQLIQENDLESIKIKSYIKNLLDLKGYKLTIGNKKEIIKNKNIFNKIVEI